MKEPIIFFVPGIPKPAGSKRGFFNARMKRVIIVDACKKSKDWKTDVQQTAARTYTGELWDCAVQVAIRFDLPRAKGHFGSGKNSTKLKPSAPKFHTIKPDVDKLSRAVLDALTGVIWNDDSQVVTKIVTKKYGDRPGAQIEVREKCE